MKALGRALGTGHAAWRCFRRGGRRGVAVALNLRTYTRLTHEEPVAELSFESHGPQRFVAKLTTLPDRATRSFELAGDDWQLDARPQVARLADSCSGSTRATDSSASPALYRDTEQGAHGAAQRLCALGEDRPSDLWSLASHYPDWLPFVDAVYGSATYLPMAEGATYEVTH